MYIKISKVRMGVLVTSLAVLLLLFSEMQFYVGLSNTAIVSGMQKTLLFAIILFSAVFLMLNQGHYSVRPILGIFWAFTFITIISTILGVTPDISVWRQIIHLTYFASIFLVYYIGTSKIGINETGKYLKVLFFISVIVYIYAIIKKGMEVQNSIYYIIVFLPVIFLIKSRSLKKIMIIVLPFLALLSNKRTALLSVIAFFLTYEFMSQRNISKKKKIIKAIGYIFVIIALYFVWPVITHKLNITVLNELSLANIQEDGGSNRLYIYAMLWRNQLHGSVKHWLIGDGYNSVLLSHICIDGAGGNWVSAHNDFFEVLYDYGLVGLSLYVSFFVMLIRKAIKMKKIHFKYTGAFMGSISMVLVISLTSHLIIYLNYYAIIFMFWAMCISWYELEKNERLI